MHMKCHTKINYTPLTQLLYKFSYIVAILSTMILNHTIPIRVCFFFCFHELPVVRLKINFAHYFKREILSHIRNNTQLQLRMLGVHMILGDVHETRSQVQDRDIDPSLIYWFVEI
jgi:hypothetical protein